MTIGLISDTHMYRRAPALPEPVFSAFAGVDLILHAGDLNDLAVLDPLAALAEVIAVCGNTDPWETCTQLRETRLIERAGLRIGLAHGHTGRGRTTAERARSWFTAVDVVVYGHSHLPVIERIDGVLLVNPGSPTDPRRADGPSVALLDIEPAGVSARLITW